MGTYTDSEYQDHLARVEWQHPSRETRDLMEESRNRQHCDETAEEFRKRQDENTAEDARAASRRKEEYDRLHPTAPHITKAELEAKAEKEWRSFKRAWRRNQTKRSKEFDALQETNAKLREADEALTPIKFVRDVVCFGYIFHEGDVTALTIGGWGKKESSVLAITRCLPCFVPNDSFVVLDRNNVPSSYYSVLARYD